LSLSETMSPLDHQLLRTSHPKHAGPYLHKIATENKATTDAISQELLDAVASQSLPPDVYKLWLCACPDETAWVLGLQQSHSILVQRCAIKAFRRRFRTSKCVDVWRAVGGTEGIVALLADCSVNHVREFSKALGQCSNSIALRQERQTLVTELMYSLTSRFFPRFAKVQNLDKRPLWKSYALLVYACTPAARDVWINEKALPELDMTKVMRVDTEHYQQQCLEKAVACDKTLQDYSALLVSLPPRMSTEDPSVPESMSFAALFLETLVEHGIQLECRGGERKLGLAFVTIIHRLACRNISTDFVLETISLMAKCAKEPVIAEVSSYSSNYGLYLTNIARIWILNPDALEAPLSELLKVADQIEHPHLVAAISAVPRKHRYRLLRWIVLTQHQIDLEVVEQLPRFRYPVPWALPMALPKAEARAWVERVVSIKGEKDIWFDSTMPDVRVPISDVVNVTLDVVRCHLTDESDNRLGEVTRKTVQYQRQAEKERDAQCRMTWVISAGYMAVASGSLDLVSDVLVWARRFNRDPLIRQFYAVDTLLGEAETHSLLSGLPEEPTSASRRESVEDNVRKGNEIAMSLLETAAMCQSEPSFYATDWSMVQRVLAWIVQVRIRRIRQMKSRLGLSDDEVRKIIWEPTLDALLDAEKLGLDDKNQALQFNNISGPLNVWGNVYANDPDQSVLWFLNELAVRRDVLWQRYRCSVHTNVMTLEAPWSRGLPIQALSSVGTREKIPNGFAFRSFQEDLPFVTKRAQSVVFMSREDALRPIPKSEEYRAAIGCFVEDYGLALNIYISGGDKKEKWGRINAAWEHATTQLSQPRLSPREAVMYWKQVFTDADVPPPTSKLDLRSAPKLPRVDIPDEKPEWNPDAGPHPTIENRDLEPTCVDCFTSYTGTKTIHDAFALPWPSISHNDVPDFWDLGRFSADIPFHAKDGFIAAGLLLVDAISQANASILSWPFPRDGVRFPAVFLHSDFVESYRPFNQFPLKLLNSTPPALLEQLTAALITKLCASERPPSALVKWTFTTLKLLAWSDNPELALPHIVHVVINLPEHSSWHRVMLHPGVLKRLSTAQSKTLIASLADAMDKNFKQRKMAASAKSSASKAPDDNEKSTPVPYVKVTTVKMLAQLMSGAEFIGENFTVEILVRLFTEATHIDIRAAATESLIAIAASTTTASIEEAVMSALETHVVPFAADLSERSPMTEQSWTEYEEKSEPPEIDTQTPSRDALLAWVDRSILRGHKPKTGVLIQQLLLPLIHKSAANLQRWLRIVLSANNAPDVYDHVPKAFGAYNLLKKMLVKHPAHMPAALFDDLHQVLVFVAMAPKQYQDLMECFNAMNPKPVGHDAYQKLSTTASSLNFDPDIAELLETAVFATSEDAAAYNLLTPAQLQAHERTMIEIRLARFDQDVSSWGLLINRYEPPLRKKETWQQAWYTYCRPLVEDMVERIEASRTTAWLYDPWRQPARLPDVYQLRLWLLTYPSRRWRAADEQDLRRNKFVKELRDLIEELARSGRPYHKRFGLVVAAAKKCYEENWAFIAWHLGTLGEEQTNRDLTMAELLRVELADTLLQGAKQPVTEEVMSGTRDMLATWSKCLDEDVRDRGISTTAFLKKNAKDKDALPM
jgi:hypothetical protein